MDRPDVEQWKGREVARLLALVETERRYYQEIVAALPVGLAVVSRDGALQSANRAFRQMFQLRTEDVHRRTLEQLLPHAELLRTVTQLPAASTTLKVEVGNRSLRASMVPIRDWDDDSEVEMLLVLEEIAPAIATVTPAPPAPVIAARPVIEAPAWLWAGDAAGESFTMTSGEQEPVGHPAFDRAQLHADDRERVIEFYRAALVAPGPHACEFRANDSRKESVWYRDSFTVTAAAAAGETPKVAGVITNITERKQVESMAQEANRLDAVAWLSRTLTHDLNNSVMVVTGYGEELLAGLDAEDSRRAEMQEILSAAHRISDISSLLLPFTRKQAYPAEPMSVAVSVARVIGTESFETRVPANLRVMADPEQLEEGLRAILWRLRQDARVTIEAKAISITEETPAGPKSGDYVDLVFLAPGVEPVSFDALLPGKDPSGPDRARLHALVREWGGGIWQVPGEVHIVLPVATGEAVRPAAPPVAEPVVAVAPAPAMPAPPVPAPPVAPAEPPASVPEPIIVAAPAIPEPVLAAPPVVAESAAAVPAEPRPQAETIPVPETVLVVEDESGIRALICKILKRQNYHVLEASTPDEATQIAAGHTGTIDLLITDVNLPQRNGRQLAEELNRSLRDLKVLYISGYTDDPAIYKGELPQGASFLQKPFTLGSLLKKVRQVLER